MSFKRCLKENFKEDKIKFLPEKVHSDNLYQVFIKTFRWEY